MAILTYACGYKKGSLNFVFVRNSSYNDIFIVPVDNKFKQSPVSLKDLMLDFLQNRALHDFVREHGPGICYFSAPSAQD